jgi:hypothetical protein
MGDEMNIESTRHRCRNPRCRLKLPVPVENKHRAFCSRGCHEQFYRARCLVCERDITEDPMTGKKRRRRHQYCGRGCQNMLLRLAFMESERRCGILEGRGLARVHVFRKRLPMMHRDSWQGRKANSGMAFCWMVWDRAHIGATTIDRISWER